MAASRIYVVDLDVNLVDVDLVDVDLDVDLVDVDLDVNLVDVEVSDFRFFEFSKISISRVDALDRLYRSE